MLSRLGSSKLISRWVVTMVAVTLIALIDHGWLHRWLTLEPAMIWRGQLWRLVTWLVVPSGIGGAALVCICLYRFATDLAEDWGDARLLSYVLVVGATAAAGTALCGLVSDVVWHSRHIGSSAVWSLVLIGWCRTYPDGAIEYHDALRVTGRKRYLSILALTGLIIVIEGPLMAIPELLTCAIACCYPIART